MKKFFAILLALVLLLACCPGAAASGEEQQKVIRVGFPIQRGLTEIDEAGDYTGYTYEYLEHLAQFSDWKYEYVTAEGDLNTQITTMLEMLANGEIDLLGCIIKNDQMEQMYEYPTHNYGVAYTVLCALDSDTSISAATFARRAVDGLRVAAYESSQSRIKLLESFCESNGYNCTVTTYPDDTSLTDVLDAGEADVSLGVDLSRDERTKIVASFSGVPYYFIGTKGESGLMEEYDAAVDKLEETEPYLQDDLYDRFFASNNRFVLTASEREYTESLDPIKVVAYNQLSPFQQWDEDGNFSGISISLLNAMAEDTGLRFEYITINEWNEIKDGFTGNALYMAVPKSSRAMHNPEVVLTHPYAESEMALYSKSNLSISELSGKVLALMEGDKPLQGYGYSEIKYYGSLQECLSAVARGEADYGLSNSYSVSYYLTRNYLNLYSLVLPGVSRSYTFAFVQPADIRLIAIFNRYIDSQDENQSYGYLVSELSANAQGMTVSDYVRAYPTRSALISVGAALFIFAVVLFILRTRQKQRLLLAESKAKTEFLSRMSHDMRTPMNAIIGLSGLACDMVKEPEALDYLDKINISGKYLLGLINDTLDMSRIESGKLILSPEPYRPDEFCRVLEDMLGPRAAEKGVRLIVDPAFSDGPTLMLDKLRFTQIFVNLVTNAIKFTPAGGTVTVLAELPKRTVDGQWMRVSVSDTGIGMSKEFQKKMYNNFEQERETGTSAESGSGLGLAIVKRLTDLMGADIKCESAPGKGTTFTVSMVAQLAPDEDGDGLFLAANGGAEHALDGRRILLVEDHPLNIKVATKLLEKCGAEVESAVNGREAVDMIASSAAGWYDAVLMDIRMPVMDGLAAARAIRALQREDAATVPIIAMTANAYADDISKSAAAGMNAHISKPIEPQILYDTVSRFLRKKGDV